MVTSRYFSLLPVPCFGNDVIPGHSTMLGVKNVNKYCDRIEKMVTVNPN